MNNVNKLLIIIGVVFGSVFLWFFVHQKARSSVERNTLMVGTNAEFPPFTFKDNSGEIIGFDIEIMNYIAQKMGKKMIIKDFPFEALIPEIQIGNIDVVAGGVSPTAERAKVVYFTSPLLENNPLIIVTLANRTDIKSIHDLKNKMVVVNEGYFADYFISEQKEVRVYRLSSGLVSDGLLALQSGRADAFVTARASAQPFLAQEAAASFSTHLIENTQETDALAVSLYSRDLYLQIEDIVQQMKKDGTLKQLQEKWFK